ncbi:hypothetical protein HZF02_06180 [Pseudomonas yamanorum]|nr:hypothetical protein HZF02_06180 [Pseudomonas yamanorum]
MSVGATSPQPQAGNFNNQQSNDSPELNKAKNELRGLENQAGQNQGAQGGGGSQGAGGGLEEEIRKLKEKIAQMEAQGAQGGNSAGGGQSSGESGGGPQIQFPPSQ